MKNTHNVRYSKKTKKLISNILFTSPEILVNYKKVRLYNPKVEDILNIPEKGITISLVKETLEGWIIYNVIVEHNSISIYGDGLLPINKR